MKTKKKVFVAGAMTFAMLGTMIPQNWNVNAASNLISNGDFEEIKSADIGKPEDASNMNVGTWYSNSGGGSVSLATMKANALQFYLLKMVMSGLDKSLR